jgi:hypothetical protein
MSERSEDPGCLPDPNTYPDQGETLLLLNNPEWDILPLGEKKCPKNGLLLCRHTTAFPTVFFHHKDDIY